MKVWTGIKVFAVVLVAVLTNADRAQADVMTYFAEPPAQPVEIFGNAWKVFADGPIDPGAPERFKKLIATNKIPPNSVIFLNSPGGNVYAALELGRLIRANHFFTEVMKRGEAETTFGQRRFKSIPAICLSACTLSYIGGVFRWLNAKSVYGVHRFFGSDSFGPDAAQVVSSAVVQYIREMGVSPDLFEEMTKAGKDEVNVLSAARLEAMGVSNNGVEKARWSLESTGVEMYLKGERNTHHGINKFMLVCAQKTIFLYVVFDPQGRGQEVMNFGAQSLFVDDQSFPITSLKDGPTKRVNGWINAQYRLTPDLIQRISSAKSVGVAFQMAYDAPMFLGFIGMELGDGRQKLAGLLATCRR